MQMRLALLALVLAGCAFAPAPPPLPAPPARLQLIGVVELPTGTEFGGTTVGGLSGIAYSAARDEYLLISDDRGNDGPARVYRARMDIGKAPLAPPRLTGVLHPRHAGDAPFAPWWRPENGVDRPDAEALRWLPGSEAYVWSSEGDFARGFGPRVRINRLDGSYLRELALPAALQPVKGEQGARGNGALEGLALTPDGRTLWLAMELPLQQDGPAPTPRDAGAPVRITALELASGRPLRQIAYPLERVPLPRRLPGPQLNGVSEILMEDAHHMLVLERSYSAGAGFGARLYRIDTRDGSDTLALDALTPGGAWRPVAKQLIADLGTLVPELDNIEGMDWGARLADGGCTLVFVSDNNFNPAQTTQFIATRYLGPPGGSGHCPEPAR
ncbi:esterase-like activity of phytase family protein [Comamonas sp. NLF-1-9]|uniref:esterase-like activity of phytase family protein n=1 Tax=Comamonas sp. NLF-1-9 TaxID=2853163 RepID=UPI001C4976CC|nr:esterase-like activity of phytase family protein [Comamonas sp. NLF-1-9]